MIKIIAILAVVVFAGAVALGYMQSERAIKNTAVQGCLSAGTETFVYASSSATIANGKAYTDCMAKKGY